MSTFKEMVYMIMDQNKLSSDDSFIEPSHILFMLSKIRAYFLKEKYSKLKFQVAPSNFQTIKVPLQPVPALSECNSFTVLRSDKKVPSLLLLNNYEGLVQVTPEFGTSVIVSYVNQSRFNSVGYDKWQGNIIYATIGPDSFLYLKSSNSDIQYLESVDITAVFEDIELANSLIKQDECNPICDPMDNNFPLEEGLVTPVLTMVAQQVYQDAVKPADETNNAADDMSNIHNYVSRITKEKYK